MFVVFKLQWPRCAIIPDLHRQRTLSIVHDLFESSVSEYVRLCDAHMAYICLSYMYVTTFRVTFLNKTHHIRMHVRTYVLCENRSSIQSFALMRLPIIHSHTATVVQHTTCILQDLYRWCERIKALLPPHHCSHHQSCGHYNSSTVPTYVLQACLCSFRAISCGLWLCYAHLHSVMSIHTNAPCSARALAQARQVHHAFI